MKLLKLFRSQHVPDVDKPRADPWVISQIEEVGRLMVLVLIENDETARKAYMQRVDDIQAAIKAHCAERS